MPPDTQAFHARNDPDVMIVENDSDVPTQVFKPLDMMDIVANNIGHPPAKKREFLSSSENNFPTASTSSGPSGASTGPRILNFNVKYCDRVVKIRLPDSASLGMVFIYKWVDKSKNDWVLGDLKQRIQNEVNVAPCRQTLSSWARMQNYEKTPFSKLMLPDDNDLVLTVKSHADGVTADDE